MIGTDVKINFVLEFKRLICNEAQPGATNLLAVIAFGLIITLRPQSKEIL